ncbi:hypothetical protein [Caldalkalibacillus uzonensis]|uniref:hypothetical protein n=1 Tax=Caldalkalibacillus uzonensis TaxID=353224 RepID=UPI0027D85A57|nr:hypothetical protein [Caldalkalibacillus uzonensis]
MNDLYQNPYHEHVLHHFPQVPSPYLYPAFYPGYMPPDGVMHPPEVLPAPYDPYDMKHHVLSTVEPLVQYGLKEAKVTSVAHAMREVAAIAYLVGRGYPPHRAWHIVESWEVNEYFYTPDRSEEETEQQSRESRDDDTCERE